MKDYGRNGRLKPEKKKKRKFEVIVNTATHGIYSDFTPMKVAKKVTSELVRKKKQIIFHLREKGKSGKTYGYIGKVRDGKVMVRTHKMSGGEMGCVFNKITPNNFKVDKSDFNNPPKIAITKFCVTRTTIIFFCTNGQLFLEKDGNKYYTYAIYREGKQVLLKKLMVDVKNELITTPIKIEDIALDNIQERNRILGNIKIEIKKRREELKKENIAKEIYEAIDQYLKKIPQQQESSPKIEKMPIAKMAPHMIQQQLNLVQVSPNIRSALLPKSKPNSSPKLNNKNNLINPYICPIGDSSIQEFKVSAFGEIFFGFDLDLLKTQPLPAKLYYKYSYRGEKFYSLIEDNGKLNESKELDISQIPLYDLLSLYEFAKSKNNSKLISKIEEHITGRANTTGPNSKETIKRLNNTNFKINKNTNIGKIKGKVEFMQVKRKTYYFFGKLNGRYKYVSFREGKGNDEKVYYYNQADLKTRKFLMDLQDRSALEDLISFIILRRIKNPQDTEFGKGVYQKATQRIGQLKFNEIQQKLNPQQIPV